MAEDKAGWQAGSPGAMALVQKVAHTLTSRLEVTDVLRKTLRAAVEAVGASEGSVLLWDSDEGALVFAVGEGGAGRKLEGQSLPADKGIAGWVFSNCQSAIVEVVRNDARFFSGLDEKVGYQTHSLVAVPLMAQDEAIGVMELVNKRSGESFTRQDEAALTIAASQMALTVSNARLRQEVRREKENVAVLEERRRDRLLQDFQDGPAQRLASIISALELIASSLGRDPQVVAAELARVEKLTTRALNQVQDMFLTLRPTILKTDGLEPALRVCAGQLDERGTTVHLQIAGLERRAPKRVEEAAFDVGREALRNVRQHAKPRNVWLKAVRSEKELRITVVDDGRGFHLREADRQLPGQRRAGLRYIKKRAESVGGRLDVDSRPGQGTAVRLVVPLK